MIPILTRAERYAMARCWGLWVRWLALEKAARETGGKPPRREQLHALFAHIREEMRDDDPR